MKTRTILLAIIILMMALLAAVAMYAGVRTNRVAPGEVVWFDGPKYFPGNVQLMLAHVKGILDDNPELTREAKRIIEENNPGEYVDGIHVMVDWDMRNEVCENLSVVLMFDMSTGYTRGALFEIEAQPRRGVGRVE